MEGDKQSIIESNLSSVMMEIGGAKLLAVTKYVGIEEVRILRDAGQSVFGESRIDSHSLRKAEEIDAEWHMIGHLQSNKAREAVSHFSWIDSIDSVKIAEKVSQEAKKIGKSIQVLIQVNIGSEPQKYGVPPKDVKDFIWKIKDSGGIRIRGLMCIAPRLGPEKTRPFFANMASLFNKIKERYQLDTLSMGMSEDFRIAVSEGATMVRIGSRLYDGTDI